ncbi:MAG TPA: hypothetical protein VLS28_02015 [Candidatus Sulfomarinibacteraceae bacterium]|nr:hypothetical protein [Candidatus Sulfomarinibacteraceae bacterium]
MTASEFAFLALGLVLGVAGGSALVMALGSHRPAREVRVTVGRDAVPRRAATLSSDAFTAHGEPARGGPADRRRMDRDMPASDPPPVPHGYPGIPVMGSATEGAVPGAQHVSGPQVRTSVPFSLPRATGPDPGAASAVAIDPVAPERDPSLDALRVQAVLAAERAQRAGLPTAIALLENRPAPEPGPAGSPATAAATDPSADPSAAPGHALEVDGTPAILRILRGDQRALLRTVATLAAGDDAMRRPWQAAIAAIADGIVGRAIVRGVIDFPVGNPFWDTFPTSQCRTIAAALAAMGFRFDGVDGWAEERVPAYRDLTIAVAAAGLDPRRIRAWPTQEEIAALYREVTVAADELVTTDAPDLELAAVQELARTRLAEAELAWRHWEIVRPVLDGPVPAA